MISILFVVKLHFKFTPFVSRLSITKKNQKVTPYSYFPFIFCVWCLDVSLQWPWSPPSASFSQSSGSSAIGASPFRWFQIWGTMIQIDANHSVFCNVLVSSTKNGLSLAEPVCFCPAKCVFVCVLVRGRRSYCRSTSRWGSRIVWDSAWTIDWQCCLRCCGWKWCFSMPSSLVFDGEVWMSWPGATIAKRWTDNF